MIKSKKIKDEQLNNELEKIILFIFRSQPTIRNKEIIDSYNCNMNFKKFSNKFELPRIVEKVPKIIGRVLDVSPYDRVNFINNLIILFIDEKKYFF